MGLKDAFQRAKSKRELENAARDMIRNGQGHDEVFAALAILWDAKRKNGEPTKGVESVLDKVSKRKI